ncbi:hypothetical protein [Risungbinella massiliensis]|uniref:hypothetical protein n=1 Tax=Risungbinella massiliensis TaxID=1329796 RepID=UPI0005CBA0BE|nr:hypothetical protein [Risungbinella massiliensis]
MKQSPKRKQVRKSSPKREVKRESSTVTPTQQASMPNPFSLFPTEPRKRPGLPGSLLSNLKTLDMAKILNGFLTFRTTLKTLSSSIQQMETIMDSTFQFFDLAQGFFPKKNRPSLGTPPRANRERPRERSNDARLIEDIEVPDLQLPFASNNRRLAKNSQSGPGNDSGEFSFANMLQNIDIQQVMSMLQNPMIQRMLSQMFQAKPASTSQFIAASERKRKG